MDNHSPLHRQGARAQLETDENVLQQLQDMVTLIAETLPLPYAGLDIALDHDGQCRLIEINSHPGFGL